MFDEYTTSNAEAEHASLKKKSLGVVANQKMTTLYEKTDMNSTQKSKLRIRICCFCPAAEFKISELDILTF